MLEKIDFTKDYAEIFEEAKSKALEISKKPIEEAVILKAQAGNKDALDKVYLYYEPVIEYLYLKNSPMYNDDREKEEAVTTFVDSLLNAIRIYKKRRHGSFFSCVVACADENERCWLQKFRVQRSELEDKIIESDIDRVAVVRDGKNHDAVLTTERLMMFLNNKDRALMLHLASGGTIHDYAREYGISRQAVENRLKYARNKIDKVFLPCKKIAESFYLDGKSVRQIAHENNMSRLEVHYYLKFHNYLYNGGPMPLAIKDAKKSETMAVSRCVLTVGEQRVFERFMDYKHNINDVKEMLRRQYADALCDVEQAKSYMYAVVDASDDSNLNIERDRKLVHELSYEERQFYLQLYKHVILEDAPPILTQEIKKLLRMHTQSAESVIMIPAEGDA